MTESDVGAMVRGRKDKLTMKANMNGNGKMKVLLESRNILKRTNVCILTYIMLNLGLIWSVLSGFTYNVQALLLALGFYALSLLVALSPVGELILRLQTGCRKIKRKDHEAHIRPLFDEAYEKARALTPGLPNGIKLYMSSDNSANAFATGRRTICVTRGLLKLPPEQIKAILGHEFGHIAHRDTYLLQGVVIGNLMVTVVVTVVRILALFCTTIGQINAIFSVAGVGRTLQFVFASIAKVLVIIGFNVFMWFWNKLGVLLVMRSSRENEYEADRFSANCGWRVPLIDALETLAAGSNEAPTGLFAILASSHPDIDSRIARLQEMD